MTRQHPAVTPQEAAEERFNSQMDRAVEILAARGGRPSGTKPVGDAEKARMWKTPDPAVDPLSLATELLSTGVQDPARLDPKKGLLIIQQHPEWAMYYAQPTQSVELADTLAKLAAFPFRPALLANIEDPEEQVKEANRIAKLAYGDVDAESMPMPEPTMPQQPTMPAPTAPAPPVPQPPGMAPMPDAPMMGG